MQGFNDVILNNYRSKTFHLDSRLRLRSEREAVKFVNERGFIFFWPVKNILLPSLWKATVGDREVPNNHDDPGHITWNWKDDLLGKKKLYYGRILCSRNVFLSLTMLPFFYALSPNYGDPENDYLIQYQQGSMSLETKMVYEALLKVGPLNTLDLRRVAKLSNETNASRFSHALDILQADFRILPIGIAEAGTWHYAFIYDTVHRHFPDLIQESGEISPSFARSVLLSSYFKSVGACQIKDLLRIFKWQQSVLFSTLEKLIAEKIVFCEKASTLAKSDWLVSKELLNK